jgi:hypothetical protein
MKKVTIFIKSRGNRETITAHIKGREYIKIFMYNKKREKGQI